MNSFGLTREDDDDSALDECYRTLGAVRPVMAEMMTRKAYYQDFGIYTAEELEDPLNLVRYNQKLDVIEGGPKRSWIRKFFVHNIKDAFGLNITEFLELPFSEARFMMEIAESVKPMEGIKDLLKDK